MNIVLKQVLLGSFALGCINLAVAQPTLSVPATNTPCAAGPGTDTVASVPDQEGFLSLFDGKSLKGWWESCKSGHSSNDNVNGGIFIADPANGAIYSQQQANGAGGLILTNKVFGNYELIFDYFGTYGDDGGVFNRTTAAGKCYQTTLDYIAGSSVGGAYGEGGYTNLNVDPYVFGANKQTITNVTNWTNSTKAQDPASFGCPAAGCTAADWATVWDLNGWNQIRIKFYGGLTAASKVKLKSWFRKAANPPAAGPNNWVPVYNDSQSIVTPASYLGFQIHGGVGRWLLGPGTWYKNIKWRPLDDEGKPTSVPVDVKKTGRMHLEGVQLEASPDALIGHMSMAHEIVLRDLSGKILQTYRGDAGDVRYSFATSAHGVMVAEVISAFGSDRIRVTRF